MIKDCQYCGKPMGEVHGNRRYHPECSPLAKLEYLENRPLKPYTTKVCVQCGDEFQTKRDAQCCSDRCRAKKNDSKTKAVQRAIRDKANQRVRDSLPDVYEVCTPEDMDRLVPLYKVCINASERGIISSRMRGINMKPTIVPFKKVRNDGVTVTYKSNAYTLQQIYDGIQLAHRRYKETCKLEQRTKRNELIKMYNKGVKL